MFYINRNKKTRDWQFNYLNIILIDITMIKILSYLIRRYNSIYFTSVIIQEFFDRLVKPH
jgi:hypothetical protein